MVSGCLLGLLGIRFDDGLAFYVMPRAAKALLASIKRTVCHLSVIYSWCRVEIWNAAPADKIENYAKQLDALLKYEPSITLYAEVQKLLENCAAWEEKNYVQKIKFSKEKNSDW